MIVSHPCHPFTAAMLEAVDLAAQRRFHTAPNPCVGAVLVRDGVVVARGMHAAQGAPHAEIAALDDARRQGVDPSACTLVVTLEPCAHQGLTPPCTEAILAAGISHVVIGALDPNPGSGCGAEVLRQAGVTVEAGIALEACTDLIEDFCVWQKSEMPYTILKLASTLDGRIATRTGHSRWISGPASRARVQELRRHMGAIIVGGNTFYQDNPGLTCRDNGEACAKQPIAVVVTSRLPAAADQSFTLLRDRPGDTIFWTTVAAAASPKAEALRKIGVRVLGLPSQPRADAKGHGMRAELDLALGLVHLRQECGCLYAMCEGGGRLGLSLLHKGLAQELHLHLAPRILGDNEATALFDSLSPLQIDEALPMRFARSELCGEDLLITVRPRVGIACRSEEEPCAGADAKRKK